ncbi:N-acetylmuramoyl-L-alanine amidase [Cellulosimicrobium funkei]|uniref:peptidoglycan recognition protein family protein n=1 Tax=Cellulosimicrobium funkei TaxID=264251 RepID=UPI0037DD867B
MARYSCAEWEPIAWMNALRHTRKSQLTFHITAGEGDPRTIATWRNGTAGSNFVVFRDGRIVQIADSACKSAADYGATHTISVEFVGKDGPLTDAQVAAAIRLAREAHERDGIPLRLAATSSDAGIGWHRLGVDGNFPHGRLAGRLQRSPLGVKTSGARGKACPTDTVIDQIHDVILPALAAAVPQGDDDMPTMHEFLNTPAYDGGGTISQVLMALDRARLDALTVKRSVNGKTERVPAIQEIADAKTAALTAVAQTGPIRRNGPISLRQEVADAKTNTIALRAELTAQSALIKQLVDALTNGGTPVDIDYDRIQADTRAVLREETVQVDVNVRTTPDTVEADTTPEDRL